MAVGSDSCNRARTESNGSYLLVTVNVYDFIKHSDSVGGSIMDLFGIGVHHSGLQIEDCEYTFNNNGIIQMRTLRMPFCRLKDSVVLGKYSGSQDELNAVLAELSAGDWRPGKYHVLRRNCNHFTDCLTRRLLGEGIPSWINRSANVANMFGITTKSVNSSVTSVNGKKKPKVNVDPDLKATASANDLKDLAEKSPRPPAASESNAPLPAAEPELDDDRSVSAWSEAVGSDDGGDNAPEARDTAESVLPRSS